MLSSPAAVGLRPAATSYPLQTPAAPQQTQTGETAGSKQNASTAPKWNADVTRSDFTSTFGDVLSAHLQETSTVSSNSNSKAEQTPASPSANSALAPSTVSSFHEQFETPTAQNILPSEEAALASEAPAVASKIESASAQSQQPQASTAEPAHSRPSTKTVAADSSIDPRPVSVQLSQQPASQTMTNALAATAYNTLSAPPATPQATQSDAARAQPALGGAGKISSSYTLPRLEATPVAQSESQETTSRVQSESGKQNDTEAFRIDLHPALTPLPNGTQSGETQSDKNSSSSTPLNPNATPGRDPSAPAPDASQDPNAAARRTAANSNTQTKDQPPAQPEQSSSKTPVAEAGAGNPDFAAQKTSQTQPDAGIVPVPRSTTSQSEPAASTRLAQAQPEVETTRTATPQQMSVRMEGNAGQVVNVRFVNQGGQVQVDVRSNDPSTAAQLRQGLNSLAGDLDRAGWKADFSSISAHASAALQDAARPDAEPQNRNNNGSALDWDQESPKKRSQAPELWEEWQNLQES